MALRITDKLKAFMRIRPEDKVPAGVAAVFYHNVIVNTLDVGFFVFADSFVNLTTIMTVFTATLTDSPFIIGLVPSILWAMWYIPQIFFSGVVSRQKKKLPMTLKMGIIERSSYILMPFLALLIPHISKELAITLLLILMVFRGTAGGFSALPWQEMIASVIPLSHRGRFWGLSRVVVQIMGVLGSIVAAFVLGRFIYPYNYAVAFTCAIIAQWISFYWISRTREPEPENWVAPDPNQKTLDFKKFGQILREDKNFDLYLAARIASFLGGTASSFLAVYGIKRFALPDNQAAVFTGLISLSGIVAYAFLGGVTDKVGPKKIMVFSMILLMACLATAILATSVWGYYLAFIFTGIYGAALNIGDMMLVLELGEESMRPVYLGLARTLTGIVLIVISSSGGLIIERWGYIFMFVLSIICTAISGVLFWLVKDRPRSYRGRLKKSAA